MPRLPAFSLDPQIRAADGREDKIELSLGTFGLVATTEEMDSLRNLLAVPPQNVREHGDSDEIQQYGWMFNRPSNPAGRRNSLQIRNRALADLLQENLRGRPLFGGHWLVRTGGPGSPRPFTTQLVLSLNPIRFVRHQPISRRGLAASFTASPNLCEMPGAGPANGEFSLDGESNWIPDSTVFRRFTSLAAWERHLRRYVEGIVTAFGAELHRVANGQLIPTSFAENFSLRKVETAWEFTTPEPTVLMMSLLPVLTSYRASGASVQLHPPMIDRTENALSVAVPLRQGVSLRVYAKTNRRVRFEIIHEEINIRELLGEPPLPPGQTSHQPRPYSQIVPSLAAIRARAAEELRGVFQYLRRRFAVSPSHVSPFRFLVSITTILRDEDMAHLILSALVHRGIVAARRAGPELVEALNLLADAGILEYDAARRGYDVAAPYVEPLAAFRRSDLRHLTTSGRQRQRRRG